MPSLKPAESCSARRIAALVLPELLCELAVQTLAEQTSAMGVRARPGSAKRRLPLGVVLQDGGEVCARMPQTARQQTVEQALPTSPLDAVNSEARAYGVRPGQTIAEACAILSRLKIQTIGVRQLQTALARIAELGLAFGPTVAVQLPDSVLIDITGAAHLMGGEAALGAELISRVRALGHVARVAIANGPRLARAFARFSDDTRAGVAERGVVIVDSEQTTSALLRLPLAALPLDAESAEWLGRLGVLTINELVALPQSSLSSRLGQCATRVLDLCRGHDPEPLVPYQPPRVLVERTTWEEGVTGSEPLLFVLRGLAARVSARLAGRGEAAQKLCLSIDCDAKIARLNGVEAYLDLDFELAAPLWREEEIRRVVASRLERQRLAAPSVGLTLKAYALTPSAGQQLDFSRVASGLTTSCIGLEELPVLLAELNADIGKDRVGTLSLVDSLRPEHQCKLVPALCKSAKRGRALRRKNSKSSVAEFAAEASDRTSAWPNAPTRLLTKPLPIDAVIRIGGTLALERRLYTIESIHFEQRLDNVEWWTHSAVSRDYLRLWLAREQGGLQALVYVDRSNGARFLQAIAD